MQIRQATPSDATNIAALGMCVWVNTYAVDGVYDNIAHYVLSELTPAKLARTIQTRTVYVSHTNSGLTGYLVLGPEQNGKLEIETLYVLPRFHGQGIGRQLVERAKSCADHLWLSAWEGNARAIGFYKSQGFIETGDLYFDLYGDKIRNVLLQFKA